MSSLRAAPGTVVFFEAPHRIGDTLDELRRTVGDCSVVVGRELTKIHEELVRGHISEIAAQLNGAKGELTVALFIGRITEIVPVGPPSALELAAQVGDMTAIEGMTRRRAINAVARKHGLAPNKVYEMVEAAKKSGS
jgi:16S rRNA (cytidine1402-2'-O)-methyltransferase